MDRMHDDELLKLSGNGLWLHIIVYVQSIYEYWIRIIKEDKNGFLIV
jgi:hypothetical protein